MADNTVYVVLDQGSVDHDIVMCRGVYMSESAAEARKDEINGPFKYVSIDVSTLYD